MAQTRRPQHPNAALTPTQRLKMVRLVEDGWSVAAADWRPDTRIANSAANARMSPTERSERWPVAAGMRNSGTRKPCTNATSRLNRRTTA